MAVIVIITYFIIIILFFRLSSSSVRTISHLEVCCLRTNHLTTRVAKYSSENGLVTHYYPPDSIVKGQFDIGVVSSFGKLLPKRVIELFPK